MVLTPPFLVSVVQSVRLLRLLRLLRLMRLAPLVRALFSAEGLRYAALLTLLTALAGGAAFASMENIPVGDGVYWAITTMTTVGYGDIEPGAPEGEGIAIAVMLIGIGFAALVIGAIAERFTNRHAHDVELTDEDLVRHVQEISARLQILERVLLQRQPGDSPPPTPAPGPGEVSKGPVLARSTSFAHGAPWDAAAVRATLLVAATALA